MFRANDVFRVVKWFGAYDSYDAHDIDTPQVDMTAQVKQWGGLKKLLHTCTMDSKLRFDSGGAVTNKDIKR